MHSWWNGVRLVAQVVHKVTGAVEYVMGIVRPRVRCSNRDCPRRNWTWYEAGGYPHRFFTLGVVASAVAELAADEQATKSSVARRCLCDRRSVGRWARWVERLVDSKHLAQACMRIDAAGLPPPQPPECCAKSIRTAGWNLCLLDHLAKLLRLRGVGLEDGPGVVALLRHQWDRFRQIRWLTKQSPPLLIDAGWYFV